MAKSLFISGAVIGSGVPFCYGAWMLFSFWSRPAPPLGMDECGMPALGAFFMMAIASPVGAIVMASIGAIVGEICDVVLAFRVRE